MSEKIYVFESSVFVKISLKNSLFDILSISKLQKYFLDP